ncbi:hypothetical protein COO60DRAFT_811608 [Scenedesmus sp. NREL 46B-D3]|nr:hypothetical protein COO60DRAFT_811608 [Scenedesmus sp. NREL 46B-D3]
MALIFTTEISTGYMELVHRPWLRVLLLLLQLLSLHCCSGSLDHQQQLQEWLVGWKGESYMPPEPAAPHVAAQPAVQAPQVTGGYAPAPAVPQPPAPAALEQLHRVDLSLEPNRDKHWAQVLSWQPRLLLHHNLLAAQECDALVAMRTASAQGTGVEQVDDQLLYDIEQRIANWTAVPSTHFEGWEMIQGFGPAEQSALHMDLLIDRLATEDFQRFRSATLLLFLSDVPAELEGAAAAGGSSSAGSGWSLVFPWARGGSWRGSTQPGEHLQLIEAGKQVHEQLATAGLAAQGQRRSDDEVLKLRPAPAAAEVCSGNQSGLGLTGFRKGSALLIWNMLLDGQTPDPTAAHVTCGPTFGSRASSPPWVAATWLHNMPVGQDDPLGLAAECADKNEHCSKWASQGFCDDAPGVLLGLRGMCRYSCGDCSICRQPSRSSNSNWPGSAPRGTVSMYDDADHVAAPTIGAAGYEATQQAVRDAGVAAGGAAAASAGQFGSHPEGPAPAPAVRVVQAGSMQEYIDCLYNNMHSVRQGWSAKAREAGVRKARNAIRKDLRNQGAVMAAVGGLHGLQQNEGLLPLATAR